MAIFPDHFGSSRSSSEAGASLRLTSLVLKMKTSGGGGLLNRVLAEHRAKSFQYDVFNTRSMTINTLKKAGAIMRYRSPYRSALRDGFYDKEGYLNGIFATPPVNALTLIKGYCASKALIRSW